MYKILIWGTGDRARGYMQVRYFAACDIRGFIDTYSADTEYMGYPVYKPELVPDIQGDIDFIVIANEFFADIIELCKKLSIDSDKLVMTDNICYEPFASYYARLEPLSAELFSETKKRPYVLAKANEYDCVDDECRMGTGKYHRAIYMEDYFRFRTFELAAYEIKKSMVQGAVAEVGVFRGTFASLINEHFSDRILFLFDTFEGFSTDEAQSEMEKDRCDADFLTFHRDTSLERVMNNLPYPDMVRVCKGYFPDTVTEEAENANYAFVSLDVDFEESTYQGLQFFYPRLSEGGMMFIHDYNTYFLDGIREAVRRYETNLGVRLKKLPLADKAGTLVILK